MARTGIGIDIGTDSIRLVSGTDRKGVFQLRQLVLVPLGPGDADDPRGLAAALRQAVSAANVKGDVCCGLTGRDVVIRYSQVPPVPDWQLRQLMDFEIKEMTDQSGDVLAADFNLIPVAADLSSDDTVLLALAKQGILDSHMETLRGAGLGIRAFTPNSIALYNAYRRAGAEEGTTLLLNIGARNTDIAVVRDGDLLFARNLSGGGELFDEALIASFNVSAQKARRLKEEMADVSPFDSATRRSAQEEKIARALSGATGQLFSMVQSTVMFAKSQTGVQELNLDRVLCCGGGSLLKGLDRYLSSNLGVPVEEFDPYQSIDASQVSDALDDAGRATSVIALGLALSTSYEDLYSVEILPGEVKKKRAFKDKTLFLILAVLLAVAFVAHDAWQSRADSTAAEADLARFSNELEKRQRRLTSYEQAVADRVSSARRVELLEQRVVAGVGVDLALTLVQRYLPDDLYLTEASLRTVTDPVLGIEGAAKFVVEIQGEGREGVQALERLFNEFAQNLDRDPLLPRTPKTTVSPASAKKPFEWTVTMNFSTPPPVDETVAEEEPEEEN